MFVQKEQKVQKVQTVQTVQTVQAVQAHALINMVAAVMVVVCGHDLDGFQCRQVQPAPESHDTDLPISNTHVHQLPHTAAAPHIHTQCTPSHPLAVGRPG